MIDLALVDEGDSVSVGHGGRELFRYVYLPNTAPLESPRPYLHPLRTRAGRVVSLFRPDDHLWHRGISWALPNVGEHNFWGGPTFADGEYRQLANNGRQQHRRVTSVETSGDVGFAHELDWIAEDGATILTERRRLTARLIGTDSWALVFETAMTNVCSSSLSFGSPTTKGRENAGYGGLFWRGPGSFVGGRIITAAGVGGDEARGRREEWMALSGGEPDAESTVVIVDDERNPQHPPQWFARTEEYAGLCPAPFFSEELVVDDGEAVSFRYAVVVADGDGARDGLAGRLATAGREMVRAR